MPLLADCAYLSICREPLVLRWATYSSQGMWLLCPRHSDHLVPSAPTHRHLFVEGPFLVVGSACKARLLDLYCLLLSCRWSLKCYCLCLPNLKWLLDCIFILCVADIFIFVICLISPTRLETWSNTKFLVRRTVLGI